MCFSRRRQKKKGAESRKSDGAVLHAAPGSSRSYGVRPVPSTGSSSLPDGGWCKCKQEGGVDDGLGHVGLTRGNLICGEKICGEEFDFYSASSGEMPNGEIMECNIIHNRQRLFPRKSYSNKQTRTVPRGFLVFGH